MLNDLEQMAVQECINHSSQIKTLASALMGNNRKELSDLKIQEKVFSINAHSDKIDRWQRALLSNGSDNGNNS